MTRAEIIDLLWDRVRETLFVEKDAYVRALDGWNLDTIEQDGEPIGIALRKGPEFHFETLGTGRPATRRLMLEELRPQLETFGYVVTRTPRHEMRQRRFNEAFGFVAFEEDALDIHYRLERTACPQ